MLEFLEILKKLGVDYGSAGVLIALLTWLIIQSEARINKKDEHIKQKDVLIEKMTDKLTDAYIENTKATVKSTDVIENNTKVMTNLVGRVEEIMRYERRK